MSVEVVKPCPHRTVPFGTLLSGDFFLDPDGDLAVLMDVGSCFFVDGNLSYTASGPDPSTYVTPVDVKIIVSYPKGS